MKILVVGGGGREHALTWKLAHDRDKPDIFCAPGNAGTARLATNLDIGAEDVDGLVEWARKNGPDLTVVGPEAPLCAGLTDALVERGLRVFGPSREAAQLEGSKLFAKDVMTAAGVPTAESRRFTEPDAAKSYIRERGDPIVVKADGLAAGKGVFVCTRLDEAEDAVDKIMSERLFGVAGDSVLVEDCLEGEEASILALVDGERVVMLAPSQDHKRVSDGDRGPNTGGMGAYSPAPVVTPERCELIREQVFDPTLAELRSRGIVYRGVLYAGLMMTETGPSVLEFNCRFGDPETQVVLPRIAGDLAPALAACADGCLEETMVSWRPEACVCVVMASGGYPGSYEKEKPIEGIGDADALDDVIVFHAGTRMDGDRTVTAGGRVLGVTALGSDVKTAAARAYEAAGLIRFDGAHCRSDIAARAFNRQ
ncbi:MAG: phosphoribosylamine--glycine ligase [Lentisphaerae bacterium]|nr:phosphoribosylamine--glycine ligase [Lentisphaerota bacterium]